MRHGTGFRRPRLCRLPSSVTIEQGASSVIKSRRSSQNGPVVVNGVPVSRERVFGGPTPEGPLPGRLLVLLSRLHRAEAVEPGQREGQNG